MLPATTEYLRIGKPTIIERSKYMAGHCVPLSKKTAKHTKAKWSKSLSSISAETVKHPALWTSLELHIPIQLTRRSATLDHLFEDWFQPKEGSIGKTPYCVN